MTKEIDEILLGPIPRRTKSNNNDEKRGQLGFY